MKRIITIVLALFMLTTCTCGAFAEAAAEPVYSTTGFTWQELTRVSGLIDVDDTDIELSSPTTNTLRIYIKIQGTSTMTKIGYTQLEVQYYSGGSWYRLVSYDPKTSTNTDTCVFSKTQYGISSGRLVRLYCRAYAQNSNGQTQTVIFTGDSITCR
ncbi:MAG: hypothetical protein IJO93_02515 [Clostridia bacterium]|nr:hypothetical protein [Clostridia bacterium]